MKLTTWHCVLCGIELKMTGLVILIYVWNFSKFTLMMGSSTVCFGLLVQLKMNRIGKQNSKISLKFNLKTYLSFLLFSY